MTSDDNTAFARLEAALRAVGDALSHADLEQLLAAEPELGAAFEGVARVQPRAVGQDARIAIDAARAALLRCRRLGAALVEFTRISLDPSGEGGYSRAGMRPALDGPSVAAAVVLRSPGPTLEARG
jgi:hypothetical protein